MSWVEWIEDQIDEDPDRFVFGQTPAGAAYYMIEDNGIEFQVFRTGVKALFNGAERWQSTSDNYYEALMYRSEQVIDRALEYYE